MSKIFSACVAKRAPFVLHVSVRLGIFVARSVRLGIHLPPPWDFTAGLFCREQLSTICIVEPNLWKGSPAPETAAALVAAWGSGSCTDSDGGCVRGSSGHWEVSASHALRLWRREMRAEQRAAAEQSRGVSTFGEHGGRL